MNKNSKMVPKLRFSDYSSEWEEYKLNDLLDFFPTNSFSRDKLNYEEGEVQNIHYGDIHTTFPNILDYSEEVIPFINNDVDLSKIKEVSYCINGDLIIADASEDYADIGKATEIINIPENKKVVAGLHTILARNKNDLLVKGFKGYLFLNKDLRLKIKIIANGVSVLGISKSNLGDLEVKIPSQDEQSKITNYLMSIDKKTKYLKDNLEYFTNFKKYLMQNIFSQKLRFDGFNEDWIETTINDLFETITDYVAAGSFADIRQNVQYQKEGYAQLVRTVDLKNKFNNDDFVFVNQHAFEYLYRVNLDEKCIVLPNIGNVGEVYFVNPDYLPFENNVLAPNAILLKSKENIKFKYHLLNSKHFKNQLDIINESAGRGKFNKTNLKKIKTSIPSSLDEQNKIAACLSKTDDKINLLNNQISQIEEFKRGLLQQMFI